MSVYDTSSDAQGSAGGDKGRKAYRESKGQLEECDSVGSREGRRVGCSLSKVERQLVQSDTVDDLEVCGSRLTKCNGRK